MTSQSVSWCVHKLYRTLKFNCYLYHPKKCLGEHRYDMPSQLSHRFVQFKRCMSGTSKLLNRNNSSYSDEISEVPEADFDANDLTDLSYDRKIPATTDEVMQLRSQIRDFEQPSDSKLLKVAVIGSPNAGKSTLLNRLMGWKIFSVSSKVHTTRENASAVFMEENTQIVFVDTPGVVELKRGRKHKLDVKMILEPQEIIHNIDLITVIVDATNKYTRNHVDPEILKILKMYPDVESILALNKIDLLKSKDKLLDITRRLTCGFVGGIEYQKLRKIDRKTSFDPEKVLEDLENKDEESDLKMPNKDLTHVKGWPKFSKVFMLSATIGDGVNELKSYLLKKASYRPWLCNPRIVTSQSPFDLALMTVREKLLDHLPQEIPYQLKLDVVLWELNQVDTLEILIRIKTARSHQMKMIIGKNGRKIGLIADEAQQDLSNTFRRDVMLKLDVT